ncbi:PSP1 domain-containing protein [Ichthyobacterium seriolicida]|nr:regulatory iron-sulfur-containing complex subunit RicT [Ichthyobacterium seriolicida]
MKLPESDPVFNCVEVRFKNDRKQFFKNSENLKIRVGEAVVVQADMGYDIGTVSIVGELARMQMRKKKVKEDDGSINEILRKASEKDIEKWQEVKAKEDNTLFVGRCIVGDLSLKMKISDVEYQADNTKAFFYYTSEKRVDFRILIKELAVRFRVRIEMKQLNQRQESALVGGIGSCGRELCCSTWLTEFKSVNTKAIKYQQLSLNPERVMGQCGKLKCCLNYELDSYASVLKTFPKESKLYTTKGVALFSKMDILKDIMWFYYKDDSDSGLFKIKKEDVHDMVNKNKMGKKVISLEDYAITDDV